MHFKVGFCTDIGRKRTQNQDCGAALPDLGLFVVADGMGGHRGGETASAAAVEIISSQVRNAQAHKEWQPRAALIQSIEAANHSIFEKSSTEPLLQGMGTTATALLFKKSHLVIGQVGDSRCYYLRPHAIWQLTRDHSLVQEKLRAGLISRQETKTDRMKNVITRSVGFESRVSVETYELQTRAEDCFLVCSDGLSGMLDDSEILNIVQKNLFENGDSEKTVKELISTANAQGGDDNITAILVHVVATK